MRREIDTVTFSSDVDDSGTTGDDQTEETQMNTINWSDEDAALTSGEGSAPAYVFIDSKTQVNIRASVTLYDQYGNTIGKGNTVEIDIGDATPARRTVSSRGVASYRATVAAGNAGTNDRGDLHEHPGRRRRTPLAMLQLLTASMVTPVTHALDDSSAAAAGVRCGLWR